MDSLVGVVVAVAVLAGTGIALWFWWQSNALPATVTFTTLIDSVLLAAGDSVWCFEGGKWKLLEDKSAPGFVPGLPPTEPGQFDGYCLRVISVRAPKR